MIQLGRGPPTILRCLYQRGKSAFDNIEIETTSRFTGRPAIFTPHKETAMQLLITSGPDASREISLGDEGVLRVGR